MNDLKFRPCPYHGDQSAMEFSSASNKFVACRKCARENTSGYRPIEDWNSAYCWKRIDKLVNTISELQIQNSKGFYTPLMEAAHKIEQLEKDLALAVEALGKVSRCWSGKISGKIANKALSRLTKRTEEK